MTLICRVLVVVWGPPAPVFPRSLTVTVMIAVPTYLAVGVNTRPFRALLIADNVPVICTVAVPLPVTVKPVVAARVMMPFAALKVAWSDAWPASGSATDSGFPLATDRVNERSWATLCVGGSEITGGWFINWTVTLNDCWVELPDASVALTITVVVPTGKRLPLGSDTVTPGLASTRSLAVGIAKVTMVPLALVVVIVMSLGTWARTGGVVSRTVTVKLAWLVLPALSVAFTSIVVTPSGNCRLSVMRVPFT